MEHIKYQNVFDTILYLNVGTIYGSSYVKILLSSVADFLYQLTIKFGIIFRMCSKFSSVAGSGVTYISFRMEPQENKSCGLYLENTGENTFFVLPPPPPPPFPHAFCYCVNSCTPSDNYWSYVTLSMHYEKHELFFQ
jgi:hypothetical protein